MSEVRWEVSLLIPHRLDFARFDLLQNCVIVEINIGFHLELFVDLVGLILVLDWKQRWADVEG